MAAIIDLLGAVDFNEIDREISRLEAEIAEAMKTLEKLKALAEAWQKTKPRKRRSDAGKPRDRQPALAANGFVEGGPDDPFR